jgi:hypothetical protein
MLVNLARKKYEVRKMLDGSVSYAPQLTFYLDLKNGESGRFSGGTLK